MQKEQLQKVGLKVTNQRLRILEVLKSPEKKHYSAEEVYRALFDSEGEVSLATVYRVLTQFEQANLVIRHNFGDHAVFELAHDEHHDHMVCVDSGEIFEFKDDGIEKMQEKIVESHGFELVDHSLILYVRRKNKKNDKKSG